MCDLGEARSCVTLKDQTIHVGNSCVECAYRVNLKRHEIDRTRCDVECEVKNLVNFVVGFRLIFVACAKRVSSLAFRWEPYMTSGWQFQGGLDGRHVAIEFRRAFVPLSFPGKLHFEFASEVGFIQDLGEIGDDSVGCTLWVTLLEEVSNLEA